MHVGRLNAMLGCMLTAGVDLSAEAGKTCLAIVDWTARAATVTKMQSDVDNNVLLEAAREVDIMGIDCPFGWPIPFIEFVTAHDRGELTTPGGVPLDWRRGLANRTTDLVVRRETRLVPLSVSADRIAHAAMRCAALLADLRAAGIATDRTGQTGKVVEVYPAASLVRWNLMHRGYKRAANIVVLSRLVAALRAAAPWLNLGEQERTCVSNDDAFDAVIAAMSARAVASGQTLRPTPEQAVVAAREGWIALPLSGSLSRLVPAARL